MNSGTVVEVKKRGVEIRLKLEVMPQRIPPLIGRQDFDPVSVLRCEVWGVDTSTLRGTFSMLIVKTGSLEDPSSFELFLGIGSNLVFEGNNRISECLLRSAFCNRVGSGSDESGTNYGYQNQVPQNQHYARPDLS